MSYKLQPQNAWAWMAALSNLVLVAWLTVMVASQLQGDVAQELQLDGEALVVTILFSGVILTIAAWVLLLVFSRRILIYIGFGLMVLLLCFTLLGLLAAFERWLGLANALPFMATHVVLQVCFVLVAANHVYKAVGFPCLNDDDGY